MTVIAPVLAMNGAPSSLGAGSTIGLTNLTTLSYTGAGAATDRTWELNRSHTISNGSLAEKLEIT